MSWAKVDDKFFAHPKVQAVSFGARGLWVTALSWVAAMETDGHVTRNALRCVTGNQTREEIEAWTRELVRYGLWVEDDDGYRFHDYLRFNPSSKQLKHKRKINSTRQRIFRSRNAKRNALRDEGRNALVTGIPARPLLSSPSPILSLSSETEVPAKNGRAPRRKRAKCSWPEDFVLTAKCAQLARDLGEDPEVEWNKFKDNALANGVQHVDWDAAWRMWLRRAPDFRRQRAWGN